MSSTLPRVDGPADAELISAVRGGDIDAYGELFARHADSARRLARQLISSGDSEDLVSDAFAKVLGVLQRGGGPDVAFRAYLLTAVRRLHVDRIRAAQRVHTTGDLEQFDPGVPFQDTVVEGFENKAAARAFASLPERWQLVLWHTEVEGQKPADVGVLLGMSANSVSALAYRAREGLRQAFLNQHAQELDDDTCRWTHQHLGAYIRNGVSRRDATKVEEHLDECRKCMAIYLELSEVNSNLSGILAPLLLGSAATAYLAAVGGAVAKGGLVLLLDRGKDFLAANAPASAIAGVAVTAILAGTAFLTINGNDQQTTSADQAPGVSFTPPAPGNPGGGGGQNGRGGPGQPANPQRSGSPLSLVSVAPTSASPTTAAADPSETPSRTPSDPVTTTPSDPVTTTPSDPVTTTPSDPVTTTPSDPVTTTPSDPVTTTPSDPVSTSPTTATGNVSVVASSESNGARKYRVTATVTGIQAGGGGLLDVSAIGLVGFSDIGSLCVVDDPIAATCTLSEEATQTFQFLAEAESGTDPLPAAMEFVLELNPGTPDDDLTDNDTIVILQGTSERIARSFGPGRWL